MKKAMKKDFSIAGGPRPPRSGPPSTQRSGVVLFTVIVVLAVGMVLLGIVMRSIVREHRQVRLRHDDRQCHRLATAGIARALVQLKQNADYNGEEWNVTAEELQRDSAARVTVRIAQNDDGMRELLATAEYPDRKADVRHTERWLLSDVPKSPASRTVTTRVLNSNPLKLPHAE